MFVQELARKWGINSEGVIAALYQAQHAPHTGEEPGEEEEGGPTANVRLEDRIVGEVERVLRSWTLSGAIEQYRM